MEKNNKSGIDRRKFFKVFGTGAVVSAAAFYGCKDNTKSSVVSGKGEIPTDKDLSNFSDDRRPRFRF